MRLLTANLFNGAVGGTAVHELIGRTRPDVFVGQEVGADAASALRDLFPCGRVEPGVDYDGRALLASQPIHVHDFHLVGRSGLRTEVDGVEVLSVHLANPIGARGAVLHRREQVAAINRRGSVRRPRVVVGDLNSTPLWPAYRRLRSSFDDGVAAWARRSGVRPRRTWSPRPGWPAVLRIDHALVQDVDLVDVEVVVIDGGDHRGLLIEW